MTAIAWSRFFLATVTRIHRCWYCYLIEASWDVFSDTFTCTLLFFLLKRLCYTRCMVIKSQNYANELLSQKYLSQWHNRGSDPTDEAYVGHCLQMTVHLAAQMFPLGTLLSPSRTEPRVPRVTSLKAPYFYVTCALRDDPYVRVNQARR